MNTTRHPLSEEQQERLLQLLSYGPCSRRPVDSGLEVMGWVQPYDGADAVDLSCRGRARCMAWLRPT